MSRVFSMGKLSPVKDDWETNKSLDWIKRKSVESYRQRIVGPSRHTQLPQ